MFWCNMFISVPHWSRHRNRLCKACEGVLWLTEKLLTGWRHQMQVDPSGRGWSRRGPSSLRPGMVSPAFLMETLQAETSEAFTSDNAVYKLGLSNLNNDNCMIRTSQCVSNLRKWITYLLWRKKVELVAIKFPRKHISDRRFSQTGLKHRFRSSVGGEWGPPQQVWMKDWANVKHL